MRAVDHCSLRIKRGAITGIIGPNGAGKTTLFNLVSGAMSPTSGQVIFDGRRIDKMGMHQTFGLGLVRTFQIPREDEAHDGAGKPYAGTRSTDGRTHLGILVDAPESGP